MAAPTALEIWQEDLFVRLPGAEPAAVESELISTLREFYTRSAAWIEGVEIKLRAGRDTYTLNPVENNIQMLYVTSAVLGPRPVGIYDAKPLRPLAVNTSDGTFSIWMEDPSTVIVYPTPVADGTEPMVLTGGCMFIDGKCHIPQARVVSHFYEHILDGCLGRLMMQVKKSYSNPANAQYHLRRFRNGIGEARDIARRSWAMTESSVWKFPQDWAGTELVRWSRRVGH